MAGLIRTETGDDALKTILRVSADDDARYEITWMTTAGTTIRTAYSFEGTVLWREIKLSGASTATQDDEEDADSEE